MQWFILASQWINCKGHLREEMCLYVCLQSHQEKSLDFPPVYEKKSHHGALKSCRLSWKVGNTAQYRVYFVLQLIQSLSATVQVWWCWPSRWAHGQRAPLPPVPAGAVSVSLSVQQRQRRGDGSVQLVPVCSTQVITLTSHFGSTAFITPT